MCATRLVQQFLQQPPPTVSSFFQNAVESRSNENVDVQSGLIKVQRARSLTLMRSAVEKKNKSGVRELIDCHFLHLFETSVKTEDVLRRDRYNCFARFQNLRSSQIPLSGIVLIYIYFCEKSISIPVCCGKTSAKVIRIRKPWMRGY